MWNISKFFRQDPPSANIAKSRLQLVVARERVGLPEERVKQLKEELYGVIAKYFQLDSQCLEIEVMSKDGKSALTVNTPVMAQDRIAEEA